MGVGVIVGVYVDILVGGIGGVVDGILGLKYFDGVVYFGF